MIEQDILIQEGINLLLTGMVIVFTFLVLLIISVNILRVFFSSSFQDNGMSHNTSNSSVQIKNETHHKIIKEVLGGMRA
ncbi:OadG family protein [Gammaproteobacteria bacterium]|jgi:Na+-transporting methylmalonyl-CoA/oxaloacetate decarboxylase gamma subunit|nr:OadG family protein [Gammaproteobacteria bacterium]MDC1131290.1 OadG family protein [Gammaproteobacteria bacterium]